MLNEYVPNIPDDFTGFMNYSQMFENGIQKGFSNYCATFSFATENLNSYLKLLDIANKKVLTVTSSGDHLINLALLNAKEVDCFDINRLCYYWTKLKLNLLMNLTYEDFIAYFTYCEDSRIISNVLYPMNINEHCYDYVIYAMVREKLEPEIRCFFDKMYETFKYSGKKIGQSKFFNNVPISSAKFNNTYLANAENYYQAQEKIINLYKNNKIKFYNSDFFGIHELESKYSIVILSNIYDYIPIDNQNNFVKYIIDDMNCILTPDAQVIVEYQYCGSQKGSNNNYQNLSNSYNLSRDIQPLSRLNLSVITVPSIYEVYRNYGQEDCVYIHKR